MASQLNTHSRPEILDDHAAAELAIAAWQRFDDALSDYRRHRAALDAMGDPLKSDGWRVDLVEAVDRSLDRLLRTSSPSPSAFLLKLRALQNEYGLEWQPRHAEYLLADSFFFGRA
jgi:hypothetical protein